MLGPLERQRQTYIRCGSPPYSLVHFLQSSTTIDHAHTRTHVYTHTTDRDQTEADAGADIENIFSKAQRTRTDTGGVGYR